ncbi:hypothetical protein GUJ93_ZPchr0586g11349 [Zizania palustris]|uniref:Uncharacterized protein n=1 Tax=Zizania palustris TaxID=103762 RepID=A0A8J5RD64_ZIZPA|nr:hypothetical protein GUJ93_ZPchr0586g11349 [Zizania palustris]
MSKLLIPFETTPSPPSSSLSTDTATSAPAGGVPQSITGVLNNPLPSASSSYWLTWSPPTPLPDALPPPSHPGEVSRANFAPYLAAVADPFARFTDGGAPASSGLAACIRPLRRTSCGRWRGGRSPSTRLRGGFVVSTGRSLRPSGGSESSGMWSGCSLAISQVQVLNATRGNLVALQQKLTVILYVSQVLAALKLELSIANWNGSEDTDLQYSQFAKTVTKEVTYLHHILSQTLLKSDVQAISRQVVQIFHSHITEAFSKLEVNTPQAKNSSPVAISVVHS